MKEICFATNNANKTKEVRLALGPAFRILTLDEIGCKEELPETQHTIEGNAKQKAEYVFKHYHAACFADDTGLEVEALKGAPGVYSARYAGDHKNNEDNIEMLLKNLHTDINRKARFRTVIALVGLEAKTLLFEGIIQGTIIHERRGKGGFGYDPVFVPEGHTRTFAEMSIEEKNTLSHRAIAVKKLAAYLAGH